MRSCFVHLHYRGTIPTMADLEIIHREDDEFWETLVWLRRPRGVSWSVKRKATGETRYGSAEDLRDAKAQIMVAHVRLMGGTLD